MAHRFTSRTRLLSGLGVAGSVAAALFVASLSVASEHPDRRSGPGPRGPMVGQMLKELDGNGDGTVTRREAAAAVETSMARHDGNGDSSLSLEEFEALWLERNRQRMVRAFQRLDQDGDAAVTSDEVGAPVDRLFRRGDKNGDGSVTREEVREARADRGGRRKGRRGDCADG